MFQIFESDSSPESLISDTQRVRQWKDGKHVIARKGAKLP